MVTLSPAEKVQILSAVFGMIGGMARLAINEEKHLSARQSVMTVLVGAACGAIIAPYANRWVPGGTAETQYGIALFFGMVGWALCTAIVAVSDKNSEHWVRKLIADRIGKAVASPSISPLPSHRIEQNTTTDAGKETVEASELPQGE